MSYFRAMKRIFESRVVHMYFALQRADRLDSHNLDTSDAVIIGKEILEMNIGAGELIKLFEDFLPNYVADEIPVELPYLVCWMMSPDADLDTIGLSIMDKLIKEASEPPMTELGTALDMLDGHMP